VREYASSNSPSSLGQRHRTFGPCLLDGGQRAAQTLDPVGLMLTDEPHAHASASLRLRATPASMRCRHAAVLDPEPGHDRTPRVVKSSSTPPQRAPQETFDEEPLGIAGDPDGASRVSARIARSGRCELRRGALGGVSGELGFVNLADDQDSSGSEVMVGADL